MGQQGDGLVEVELIDDGPEVDAPDREPRVARGRRLRQRWAGRGPRTRWNLTRGGVLAVAVALVSVVAVQEAGAGQEAAFARLPGISPSLDQPVREVWRMADALPLGWVGDDLLVGNATGSQIERIDARTGDVRWTLPTTRWCTSLDGGSAGSFYTFGVQQQVSGRYLVCGQEASGQDPGVLAGSSAIQLIDIGDGSTRPGPVVDGDVLGFGGVDGDLIVAAAAADQKVRALRWSPDTGETMWTYESADVLVDAPIGSGNVGSLPGAFVISVLRTVFLDPATGRELTLQEAAHAVSRIASPDQADVVLSDGSTLHAATDDSASRRRTSPDGSELPAVLGSPILFGVDDGSVPDIALATSPYGQSSAIDLTTGTVLWSLAGGLQPVARLGGRAVFVDSGAIKVVDLRTGDLLWSDPGAAHSVPGTAVTDGHRVGYLTHADGTAVFTVADLATGSVRSRHELGVGDATIIGTAGDGTAVVLTADSFISGTLRTGLVALRP